LLSVERQRRQNGKGDYMDVTTFAVVTDGGEMRNFELGPGTSVRIAEHDLTEEVGRYLNLVGSSRARDLRRMTIAANGPGDRDVFVSYISEVPVWKSTYRIILPEKTSEKPLLQGWAIVDNTVGEDWKDVQLSLVAGAPQSFIQNISQPYYMRRPTVEPPQAVTLTPQTHELALGNREFDRMMDLAPGIASGTGGGIGSGSAPGVGFAPGLGGLQGVVKDTYGAVIPGATVTVRNEDSGQSQSTTTDARGIYRFYNLPPGNSALFVQARGFKRFDFSNAYLGVGRMNEINATLAVGAASETVAVAAAPVQVETASMSAMVSNQPVEAQSKDLGDFFEYAISQKITIGRNQSALVPILSARVEAEKVSLWNEEDKEIRRAVWLKNTSGLTVDSGTFNVLESDAFAGEGVLETLHPDERRLLSYAADPALRVKIRQEGSEKPVSHLRIAKGVMVLTRELRETRNYTVHNADKSPRQLVIEHPARENWTIVPGGPNPEETTESFLRFRLSVAPDATEHFTLEERHPENTQIELNGLDEKQVTLLVENQSLTPAAQQALHKVLDQKNQVGALENEISSRQHEIDAIARDQARVRENMKALKGSSEEKALLQRYARQLDQQEDRLNNLQKEINDLNGKKAQADVELDRIVQAIAMDDSL
jgi:hypothetical protein